MKLAIGLLAAALLPGSALALEATGVLKRASAAMGLDEAKTLKYSAAGSGGGFGQPYTAGKALPRLNVSFVRSVNYDTGAAARACR